VAAGEITPLCAGLILTEISRDLFHVDIKYRNVGGGQIEGVDGFLVDDDELDNVLVID
jgi:hypothetical protein